MEEILTFIMNAEGLYDLGSIIKMFVLMMGIDGVVITLYAIASGFNGRR